MVQSHKHVFSFIVLIALYKNTCTKMHRCEWSSCQAADEQSY